MRRSRIGYWPISRIVACDRYIPTQTLCIHLTVAFILLHLYSQEEKKSKLLRNISAQFLKHNTAPASQMYCFRYLILLSRPFVSLFSIILGLMCLLTCLRHLEPRNMVKPLSSSYPWKMGDGRLIRVLWIFIPSGSWLLILNEHGITNMINVCLMFYQSLIFCSKLLFIVAEQI